MVRGNRVAGINSSVLLWKRCRSVVDDRPFIGRHADADFDSAKPVFLKRLADSTHTTVPAIAATLAGANGANRQVQMAPVRTRMRMRLRSGEDLKGKAFQSLSTRCLEVAVDATEANGASKEARRR